MSDPRFRAQYTPDFSVQGPPNVKMIHVGFLGGIEVPAHVRPKKDRSREWRLFYVWLLLMICLFAVCCGGKKGPVVQPPPEIRTVTVEVPTFVKAKPPAELLAPLTPPLPLFISPFDPNATSALTAEGERLLRALIEELLGKLRAWEAWAKE